METFRILSAVACPLGLENVDTDQLIPARFMSRPRSAGYGGFLLHDLRLGADGALLPGFPLNEVRYAGARILVARRNFGTGSSREAAVYALWDYGIRCVIAPSFGGIFEGNAVKNGLLPAVVSERELSVIETWLANAHLPDIVVDLEQAQIVAGPHRIAFAIEPVRRLRLLNGWDDLDLTDRHKAEIAAFRAKRFTNEPWVVPTPEGGRATSS
jgi:3-isopropylmalate/(R)-2-methylmalate dehydratase small subunit